MANWKESAKKSLENRASNTSTPTVSAPSTSAAVSKTPTTGTTNSGSWQAQAKKSLESRNYVAPENRLYELKLDNGKNFGTVSYGAYNAIKNNTLDKYTPKNDNEKKALDDFKAYANEMVKEQEATEKQKRIDSNPVFKRYNIDPDNFTMDDFEKWAEEHGFEYRMGGNDLTGAEMKWLPKSDPNAPWYHFGFTVMPTKQEQEDKKVLETLAENNQRREVSQTDRGAARAAVVNLIDGLSFGAINAYAEWDTKRDYEKAGLNSDDYVGIEQMDAKTLNDHKIASVAGNVVGSVVSLGPLSKGVSAATKGVKWIAKSPQWVQSAINSGITFAVSSGAETAFDGGNLEDVLKNAGINFVGGAVGGALSSKVGSIGEKILFNKGLQHKIIPEMVRTGISSAVFAGGKTASTYFLYPEDYRPTAEEMAKDIGVAFAFGAISSGINTMKASAQNKKYLDDLYQKMASDYENMAKANISSKSDTSGIRKFAKNVIGYSNAMEAYLTGKEYSATIDGKTYTFTPNKVRLVGQDKYVKSILSEMQTIRNNANAVLNGVGTPSTDLATTSTAPASSGATTPAVASTLPSGSKAASEAATPVPPVVSTPVTSTTATTPATPATPVVDTSSPAAPATVTGELGEVMSAGSITKFTPETASGEIKRLENILIAKGADDVSRQEIVATALEIEKALVGSDKTIRSVFNNVSKITSNAVAEIKSKAGTSSAYWKLFGENFKAIPSGSVTDNVELVTEYSNAYAEALKNNNPEKYNIVIVSADGTDLVSELPQTIMQNVIPANVQNAGAYRLVATQIKNIVNDVDVQISSERTEIYGANAETAAPAAENAEVNPVEEIKNSAPKNIALTRVGDFYEAYGDEAVELASKLNLIVTPKTINGEKVQMVGFPAHALENYKNALGSAYNVTISDTPSVTSTSADNTPVTSEAESVTSINEQNTPVSTENTPVNEDVTDTDVINHAKEVDGLKLINTEESTLVNGKTLLTGVYELNSDKDFSRKSYKKEEFSIFCKAKPWVKTVDGTTYGHYGFTKSGTSGYIVTYLPGGLAVTKANTENEAKLLLKKIEDNLPELPLSIKAFGDEYRCYGLNQELATDIKNVIDSASESASEINLPLKNKKELISYLKNHKGGKIGVSYNQGAEDIRTIISASNTAIVTERTDGQQGRLSAKANELSYTDDGFVYTGGNGVTVSYRFISEDVSSEDITTDDSVTETPESVTEPTESVIKKADSVTETPENVTETKETTPVGQLLEDYNDTVDNILSVSDETAKEFADKRVAVEVLKNTPTVILDNVEDARDLKVIINYNKLYLAVRKDGVFKGHYHNLGADIAKRLPEFLNTPDAIIQLANGRLNLFATVATKRGNNGIVSVELNSTKDINGKYEDYNVVVTMFSSDDNYAQNLISGDGVTEKYKREDLSQVNPQLYKWLTIINDKSSTDNIVSQDSDIVNSSAYGDVNNSTGVKSDKDITTAIKKTLKPEIISNAELMNMLTDRFGSDGIEGLASEIIARYKKNKSIGPFESLFADAGEAVYNVLSGNMGDKYSIEDSYNIFNAAADVLQSFEKQIDDWLNRELPTNEMLKLGQTPEILKQLGAKNLPVMMNQDVLVKITGGKHTISLDDIKQLPDAIADPIMIFKSNTTNDAFVVLTELVDKSGNDVVVALHLNKAEKHIRINRIATVYGKDNIVSFVRRQISFGNLKYMDKNKSQEWSQSRGLQLPKLADTNPDNNIVLYKDDIVNTYNMKKSERYSTKVRGNNNGRNNLLFGNSGRGLDESAQKQAKRISEYKQKLKGKTAAERQNYAKELLEKGFTEEKIDGEHKYNLVKPEAYNDDMLSIVEEAKKRGKEVGFFIGSGQRKSDRQRDFLFDGIKVTDTKILLRYDGIYSPQTLLKHEEVHADWENPEMQKAKDIILNDLTDSEKKRLLSNGRYKNYMDLYENDTDAVWEEFIADIFANMNDYSADYIDIVTDYWYDGKVIDRYSPAEYNNIMDAGGDDVLDAIGFGDEYALSEKWNSVYSLRHRNWYPDLSKAKLSILKQIIKKDIKTSRKSITDTANWIFTDVDDTTVFAIYSTEDVVDPTLLYESKGEQAECERDILLNLLEDFENVENTFRKSTYVSWVSGSGWLRKSSSNIDGDGTVGRGRSNRDVGVLQGQSKRKPSRAFENVIRNLIETQEADRRNSGNIEQGNRGIKYTLSTSNNDVEFWEEWLNKAMEYGVIPKGENPARDIDVPKKISDRKVVSRFARTMLETGITPDDSVSEFEKLILDGTMTHEVITNKKASDWAKQQIEYLGFEEAVNRWSVLSDTGKIGKNEFALGMELYNQCITNKDVHNAMKIAAELVAEATRAGQTLQSSRMLKLMTPDGQLYYLEKSIQKMNEEFRGKLGEKYKDIELDEELMKGFLGEKDENKRNNIYDKICQNIADQIPATMLDKWNSWRYLAMLGNPRTHLRNVVGNAVFVPSVRIKNYIGAVIEIAAKVDVADRTKSLYKNKAAVEFATKDFEAMAKVIQGENAKYAVTSDIESKRTIFKTKWLEKLRLKNFNFLEKEDMLFLKMHYVDALARLITVRNIDVKSVNPQTLEVLRAYAIKEAQAATYRDANSLAEGLNKLQRKLERSDNKAVRATSVLVEGVTPFKKTPMNIAKQGINYSPIGILKGTYKAFKKLKGGNATVSEVIDDFAKGLTGTGVMLLGLWLASLGILVGAKDKSKKEKEFDKMIGEQSYAVKVKDAFSYTIDWMTPSNLSLFIGAKLYDLAKDDFSFADIVDALSTVTEPLLELSVFSGVNGVIESAQYSDSEALLAIGSDMITSYLLQALPTIGGQLSRIIDENKREYYYTDKNSDIPKGLQRLIGQASSKIPFASFLFEPAIDEWGREEKYGNVIERAFENTISPGYYAEDNYTTVDKELKELYERTGESSVLPVIQQKYYKENKIYYYMSAEDYTEVKKMRGQLSFKYVKSLLDSSKYNSMTDEEKVNAIEKCYEQAGKETKEKMLEKVKSKA